MSTDRNVKRKVLHVIHGFGPGGVETWLLACVKYLNEHPELNIQFDFLATGGSPKVFDEQVKSYGSNIFYARYSYKSLASFRQKLRAILKENNYIAIHDHEDFISGWHFWLGGKYLPSVRVSHLHNPYNFVHNYVVNPLRRFSFKMGRRLMARLTGKITATSDSVMDEYGYDKPPFVEKRVKPAYCGFDTEKFLYDENAKATICNELKWDTASKIALFVGRIGLQSYDTAANQKNPEFAFEIAKKLVVNNPGWKFLFVGFKGETGERMEREVIGLNQQERIKFLGIRQDIPKIMSAADVFVFPSLWEGLGMVAVEAQCAGLNILMSDAVPREAIVAKDIVTLKSLSDTPDEWTDTIVSLHLPINRRKYAAVVANSPFSIHNSINRLISLYER
ncbi:MAG: glycosyltransferase [Chitinophagaceae bacterium]|nr:glycosyltransferase [Chitinophagaceae bacterium]